LSVTMKKLLLTKILLKKNFTTLNDGANNCWSTGICNYHYLPSTKVTKEFSQKVFRKLLQSFRIFKIRVLWTMHSY